MTIEEYGQKVAELLKSSDGKEKVINGIQLNKDCKFKASIISSNGKPGLVFCEVDENNNPIKIAYCIELGDIPSVRALQIWLGDAIGILAHDQLQQTDINELTASPKKE